MSRLKSSRGMTFMELLCAVLILMMSTALVLVGVNLALTTYRANMEASEAQVLYSTLNGLQPLVDPLAGVPFFEIGFQCPLDGQFRVDGFLNPLSPHLRQPEFERLSLG